MGKMIEVEGFKAFRGRMEICFEGYHAMIVSGDWLYNPYTDCWYCGGVSYPVSCCTVLEVE